jgi:sterol desaturase/sphingolipid hydroxylase (fatty acid hydroxylase superfamily)
MTMHDLHHLLSPWSNPVTYAIPFFLLFIGIELAALKWLDHDDVTGYEPRDAKASLLMGLGSIITTVMVKVLAFVLFIAIYLYAAPWHMPMNHWWSWVIAVLAVDFTFYWTHRFLHRARVGWAAHQAHHSSEYMNFGTALRQKWNPWFDVVFWLPLPFIGIPPWAIFAVFSFNLIYQFTTHTEMVDKLWAPIEFVMNTPSHHRVHHGSDELYLDKNYAGIFIIWDRMFGTFQKEIQRPKYGLTTPIGTYNVWKLQYGHYADLWVDVRNARSFKEKLQYLFKPPGWAPADLVGPSVDESAAGAVPAPTR